MHHTDRGAAISSSIASSCFCKSFSHTPFFCGLSHSHLSQDAIWARSWERETAPSACEEKERAESSQHIDDGTGAQSTSLSHPAASHRHWKGKVMPHSRGTPHGTTLGQTSHYLTLLFVSVCFFLRIPSSTALSICLCQGPEKCQQYLVAIGIKGCLWLQKNQLTDLLKGIPDLWPS